MMIDVPIFIAFDCQGDDHRRLQRAAEQRVVTLRYDSENDDAPAQYTDHYPPRTDASWSMDKDGMFFGFMSPRTDTKIRERADSWPYDYCSDAAEGERRQAELDQEVGT